MLAHLSQVYRHIVLAVFDTTTGLFGSLGISRCSQLMDKPLQHSSLSSLVDDFHSAYRYTAHTTAPSKQSMGL